VHAVSLTLHDFCVQNRSNLGKFGAEFKKALARESGAQGVLFDEKTEGRKSHDAVPLKPKNSVCLDIAENRA
jgi:hypothetical protein